MSTELRALIFDVDGTLADTEEFHRRAFNATFAAAGLNWWWNRSTYRELLRVAGGRQRMRAFAEREDPATTERDDFEELLTALHAAKTRRYDASLREEPLPLRAGHRAPVRRSRRRARHARDRDDDDRGESRRTARTAIWPHLARALRRDRFRQRDQAPQTRARRLSRNAAPARPRCARLPRVRGFRERHPQRRSRRSRGRRDPDLVLARRILAARRWSRCRISAIRSSRWRKARRARRSSISRFCANGIDIAIAQRASGEGRRMLLTDKTTFTEFLIEARRNHPEARGDLNGVLHSVATACKAISRAVAHGSLADLLGNAEDSNVHGERQKKLDVIANDIFIRLNENRGYVAGMASEELEAAVRAADALRARQIPSAVRSARRLVEHRRQRLGRHRSFRSCARRVRAPIRNRRISCNAAPSRSRPATRSTDRRRCSC